MTQNDKQRLDVRLVGLSMVATRSQAESYIKLNKVTVNGESVTKSGHMVSDRDDIKLSQDTQYVSRAALKLGSIVEQFKINFNSTKVLDIGSSTGGFTDYALKNGADKVIAVEVGSGQMHPSLRSNPNIELYEKTDIRLVQPFGSSAHGVVLNFIPDFVLMDLSFVSLRDILPHVFNLVGPKTKIIAMVKPQFEAQASGLKHKGVIKNDKIRRSIFKDFENWSRHFFVILDKSDSKVSGAKGNVERFYLMTKVK